MTVKHHSNRGCWLHRFSYRRAGDLPEYCAAPSLAKDLLGWEAKWDIDRMCADTWRWQSMNPLGFVPENYGR